MGQVAHSDVIQAEIQYRQQKRAFDDAKLEMETARMDLAVLLFPVLNENFTVVDDLDSAVACRRLRKWRRWRATRIRTLRWRCKA